MSNFSDVFSLPLHFEFVAIFSYCLHVAKFVCLLKRQQRLKQEQQKSPAGTRQTYDKNLAWFGEIERKLAKLPKATFTYRSSSSLFYAMGPRNHEGKSTITLQGYSIKETVYQDQFIYIYVLHCSKWMYFTKYRRIQRQ